MAESHEAQFVGPNTRTGRLILEKHWGEPWRKWLDCALQVELDTARTEPGHDVHVRAVNEQGNTAMVPLNWIVGLPLDARQRAHMTALDRYPSNAVIIGKLGLRRARMHE